MLKQKAIIIIFVYLFEIAMPHHAMITYASILDDKWRFQIVTFGHKPQEDVQ